MKALALSGALVALLAPAGAHAATLVNDGGTLTYTGTAAASDITFSGTSTVTVQRGFGDHDPISATGCSGPTVVNTRDTYQCEGVVTLVADGGPGDDGIRAGVGTIYGGSGDDTLVVGRGTISGGPGIDVVPFTAQAHASPIRYSLDGTANDGVTILSDVEDLWAIEPISFGGSPASYGPYTLIGSDAGNELTGGNSADTIVGGGGFDTLIGAGGDDTIDARDGAVDHVSCGPGFDTVLADSIDRVGEDCESIQRTAVPPFADRPPTGAWKSTKTKLAPNAPTALEVTAGDDLGVTDVRFLDDDRALCTVTAPPYTCTYQPRVLDVGANLLTAVVTDSTGQTTTVSRLVTVDKFSPTAVTVKATRRGARYVVTGKVTLPAGAGCGGKVTVSAKGVHARTVGLSKMCTYRVTITTRGKRHFTARFDGTKTIAAKRSR